MFVPLLGMFLMNSLPALVLFESGSSWSFVSWSFSREFVLPMGDLECPLQVSIANEHGDSDSSIYQGCILEIFRVSFPIDLILIPMGDVSVIVAMDWLSHFGATIDCEGKCVVVRTLSGEELVIYGEGTRLGSVFCSSARAW